MSDYDPTVKQAPCPDEDATILTTIEAQFGIEVWVTGDQQMRLHMLLDEIARAPWNQPKGGLHWLAMCGSKPGFSAMDAAFMGHGPVDPDVRNGDEPSHDDSVLYFESCSREYLSDAERDRKREPRDLNVPVDVMVEALDGLARQATRLQAWFQRTTSLNGAEAHDLRGVLFMINSWIDGVKRWKDPKLRDEPEDIAELRRVAREKSDEASVARRALRDAIRRAND